MLGVYLLFVSAGLEILAFPCNQFGEEEPGSNDQILEFVCTRFKSEFPVFDKVNPNKYDTTFILQLTPRCRFQGLKIVSFV